MGKKKEKELLKLELLFKALLWKALYKIHANEIYKLICWKYHLLMDFCKEA